MRLSYRGSSYEYNPPSLEVTEAEILGRYSKTDRRCQTLEEVPVPQSSVTLIYRGASYMTRSADAHSGGGVAQAEVTRPHWQDSLAETVPVLKEIARVHHGNLTRNLERRLQVAREQGNQVLVNLLEAERGQLA